MFYGHIFIRDGEALLYYTRRSDKRTPKQNKPGRNNKWTKIIRRIHLRYTYKYRHYPLLVYYFVLSEFTGNKNLSQYVCWCHRFLHYTCISHVLTISNHIGMQTGFVFVSLIYGTLLFYLNTKVSFMELTHAKIYNFQTLYTVTSVSISNRSVKEVCLFNNLNLNLTKEVL